MTKAQEALTDLVAQSAGGESNLYPFIRDVFVDAFGYPKDHVRVNEKEKKGIPDVSLIPADVSPKSSVFWVVCEVKKERGAFRAKAYREDRWEKQLKRYVSADTVYALLIDPITIAVFRPDGTEVKVVELDKHSAEDVLSPGTECSLASLLYENSVCEASLSAFKEGETPSRYLDVTDEGQREKFYEALRVSARELIDFSEARLDQLEDQYQKCLEELNEVDAKVQGYKAPEVAQTKSAIRQKYKPAVDMFEGTLKEFEGRIGRQVPPKEEEAHAFLQNLYATEGSSLVLARILFVRFLEDHDMTKRKISNGGIKAFRQYYEHVKDNYQFLLTDAYRDAEHVYSKLFEPSIFDWSHKGDGQLSRLLLRIFYRLNAFDFQKITGDILGNLYERFLDLDKRKKLGEYYTPLSVARYVLEEIGFYENPGPLLDPSCGSGTFLIAATTGLIKKLTDKGIQPDLAVQEAVKLVHGLDINMFAAFIAQLQLLWHLLPILVKAKVKELPDLRIYGGVNSLEWLGEGNLMASILDLKTEDAAQARAAHYRYVVGNPPYIRNERMKETGPWRDNYEKVEFRNSDAAYFFVARAIIGEEGKLPTWLEDKGRLCFVLPRAVADADAASTLREKLLEYKIIEVTDLEDVAIHIFPSPQASGRATVAPILLFIEKTHDGKSSSTEVVTVPEQVYLEKGMRRSELERTRVSQKLFKRSSINPNGQILTTVRDEDVPVLEKAMVSPLRPYMQDPPAYAIKVGSPKILKSEPGKGLLPIAKGLNVSTFFLDPRVGNWVDVDEVVSKSIWGRDQRAKIAYALSGIALAPQCAAFSPSEIALNDSATVFVPKPEFDGFPWDVLINSSIARFVHLLSLRTALVGVGTSVGGGRRASWCHFYPRVVSAFPVPQKLVENPKPLMAIASQLRHYAAEISKRWERVDQELESSPKKPLSLMNIDFKEWQGDLYEGLDLRLERGPAKESVLRPYDENQALLMQIRGPYELLKVAKYVIEGLESPPTAREVQRLAVPDNYGVLASLIERAEDPKSPDIKKFQELHTKADELIAEGFGLTKREAKHVESRLSNKPLDVLQPRWPWKVAKRRTIKGYSTDRFG